MNEEVMNEFDYQFLTDTWEGVKGAAYAETAEFCREFGWIDHQGEVTELGQKAIDEYEKKNRVDVI